MPDTIKCGIIGCGVIGPLHAESYQRSDDVKVLWACDLVEEKARALADKYGIPSVTTDYRDVLADSDVDAISVCTDHASHSPISVDALEAGKHVLCEKALAASTKGLDAMLDAGREHPDLIFSGVFQHRFDKVYKYVKMLIDDGAFGDLLTINLQMQCLRKPQYYSGDPWRGTWEKEGGSLMINQAIHFIDLVQWMSGGIAALSASFANLTHGDSIETEDTAVAALRFRNGALGSIAATSSSHLSWDPCLFIYGSRGSLELRSAEPVRVEFDDTAMTETVSADLAACTEATATQAGKSYYGPSHPTQIADFIQAIRDQREPFVTAESAGKTVAVVLGIYTSHHEQRWVDFDS